MKATAKMLKMMVLAAVSATVFLSLATAGFAAPPPTGTMEIAKPQVESVVGQDLEIQHMAELDLEIIPIGEADEPADGPAATDPTDGDPVDEEAGPDEFEDLPEGSEGDVGDDGSDESVPADESADPSHEETQPPITVVTTSVEETPTQTPHRDHLAFTGGAQVMYLLGGLLIIAAAAAVFLLGRATNGSKQ